MSTYWYNKERDAYEYVLVQSETENLKRVVRFSGQSVDCLKSELLETNDGIERAVMVCD